MTETNTTELSTTSTSITTEIVEGKDDLNFEVIECEKVEELFVDNELIQPDWELFRLNTAKGRLYFRFEDAVKHLNPVFYSGSTAIGKEMPKEEALLDWIISKGKDAAERYFVMRSHYGSFMHTCFADLAMGKGCNLDSLPSRLEEYFYLNHFHTTSKEMAKMGVELQKGMIGILQWITDYKVKFLGVELPLYSDEFSIASPLDILCFCEVPTSVEVKAKTSDKTKKVKEQKYCLAIVDLKSSLKGFYEENRFQLESCKNMLVERFPDFGQYDIRMLNLRPTDWRKLTTRSKPYSCLDQTEKINIDRYNHYLALSELTRNKKMDNKISVLSGELKIGTQASDYVATKTLRQIVEDGDWTKYLPKENILK